MKQLTGVLFSVLLLAQAGSNWWLYGSFLLNRQQLIAERCERRFTAGPVCGATCYLRKVYTTADKTDSRSATPKPAPDPVFFCMPGMKLPVGVSEVRPTLPHRIWGYGFELTGELLRPPQVV